MTVTELAAAQLAAYNAHDIDAFCACYAEDVRVLDADGHATIEGIDAFRATYGAVFIEWDIGAAVDTRLSIGAHAIDDERWWRTHRTDGRQLEGRVLVRYTAREGKIAVAQFFRP